MKLIIGADIVPTENNLKFFCNGNISEIVDDGIIKLLQNFDYRICNLETPLCDVESPIDKCGSNHFTTTKAVNALNNLQIDLCAMANNHIMDQGEKGLFSTIDTLEKNHIAYCGVGENVDKSSKLYTFENDNEKVGIFNCAEHEFSIAGKEKAGACPFDSLYSFDDVSTKKESVDYLIVLFHGGKEYYQYPSPQLQRICRRFIEKGADLVICQHSHCIGCEEKYQDGTIVYGQGNFIFYDDSNDLGKNSLLIGVDTSKNILSYYPITYSNRVTLSNELIAESVINEFQKRSNQVKEEDFLELEYCKFAMGKMQDYYRVYMGRCGNSFIKGVLNKLTKGNYYKYMITKNFDKKSIIKILNYVKCEAHNELVIKGLEESLKTIGK